VENYDAAGQTTDVSVIKLQKYLKKENFKA